MRRRRHCHQLWHRRRCACTATRPVATARSSSRLARPRSSRCPRRPNRRHIITAPSRTRRASAAAAVRLPRTPTWMSRWTPMASSNSCWRRRQRSWDVLRCSGARTYVSASSWIFLLNDNCNPFLSINAAQSKSDNVVSSTGGYGGVSNGQHIGRKLHSPTMMEVNSSSLSSALPTPTSSTTTPNSDEQQPLSPPIHGNNVNSQAAKSPIRCVPASAPAVVSRKKKSDEVNK